MNTTLLNNAPTGVKCDTENPDLVEIIDDTIRIASTRFDTTDCDCVTVQNFYYRLYQLRDILQERTS